MPFTDEQVMLCLAALAYRGYLDASLARVNATRLAIARGLHTLAPLRDGWDLVWGPACYRAPVSVFDDALVYVVRRRRSPACYAVVIRGTNPVSAFDWIFGDFWTAHVTPWRYAHDGGSISLSTALGLALIQDLRSAGPRTEVTAPLWKAMDAHAASAPLARRSLWESLGGLERIALNDLLARFATALEALTAQRSASPVESASHHVQELIDMWQSDLHRRLLDLVEEAARATGRADLTLLALFEDDIRLRVGLGPGVDLRTFLSTAVKQAGGALDIIVTGHSKGGALASTVALWLADTQGSSADTPEGWDPHRWAAVSCFSYAGPTAGDSTFAAHSDRVIGARCHRIANSLDVVPHAWAVADLQSIPKLYQPTVGAPPGLSDLMKLVCGRVERLGYQQVAQNAVFSGSVDPALPLFFPQVVYQHLEAYLRAFGLTEYGITTATFFDPTQLLVGP